MRARFITKNHAELIRDFEFKSLGLLNADVNLTFSYFSNKKYLSSLKRNTKISGVVTTKELAKLVPSSLGLIVTDDPESFFYALHNTRCAEQSLGNTRISNRAIVLQGATISDQGVTIGRDTVIEGTTVIKSGVAFGNNCFFGAGSVVGGEGFEVKTIYDQRTLVRHEGRVIIGDNAEIQYNCCIDKGIFGRDTIIGRETKIDNLCHVAHGVQIGNRCTIAAKAVIAGSATIGDDVWIGPGSNIADGVTIGNGARITIGATVVRDVPDNTTVTGYFAQEHGLFIKRYLSIFRNSHS